MFKTTPYYFDQKKTWETFKLHISKAPDSSAKFDQVLHPAANNNSIHVEDFLLPWEAKLSLQRTYPEKPKNYNFTERHVFLYGLKHL